MTAPLPEAYELGSLPFLGATIHLDSHPLIPRTETEFWVEQCINSLRDRPAPLRVADLFAGSGCIGIAVLLHLPAAQVTFGEIEKRHLTIIYKNIRENGIDPTRARIVQSDVWSAMSGTFDVILANPPYLSEARIARVEASVLEHEPEEALFAEDDGFAFIEKTIAGLPTHMAPDGVCYIEHEPEHSRRIALAAQALGYSATVHKDQYGTERYSVILKA